MCPHLLSASLSFCTSVCLSLSLAAQRGILAFLRSVLGAATLRCQSVLEWVCSSWSLGPTSNAGSLLLSSVTTSPCLSFSVPGLFPRTEEGVCRGRSVRMRAVSRSLALSRSLSPPASPTVSSCLTARTCPWLCRCQSHSEPASLGPSPHSTSPTSPPLSPAPPPGLTLPSHAAGTAAGGGAQLLSAAPAVSGPRPS